jgi:quercetin dioxygenase-like cupin family protein
VSIPSPLFVPPGGGEKIKIRETKQTTLKLTTPITNGEFGFFEHWMAPRASGASLHIHKKSREAIYVVKGEIQFDYGDRKEVGEPGALLFIPPEAPHGFTNVGDEEALLLFMLWPLNNRDEYLRGVGDLTANGRNPSREELAEHMARYDQYLL